MTNSAINFPVAARRYYGFRIHMQNEKTDQQWLQEISKLGLTEDVVALLDNLIADTITWSFAAHKQLLISTSHPLQKFIFTACGARGNFPQVVFHSQHAKNDEIFLNVHFSYMGKFDILTLEDTKATAALLGIDAATKELVRLYPKDEDFYKQNTLGDIVAFQKKTLKAIPGSFLKITTTPNGESTSIGVVNIVPVNGHAFMVLRRFVFNGGIVEVVETHPLKQ